MSKIRYVPSTHKIGSVTIYYETPFMQFVFDAIRTDNSYGYMCDILHSRCPKAGVGTWTHNGFANLQQCKNSWKLLPAFDDGDQLALSTTPLKGGGFDGNSSSCRLLHSFLATINTDHCPHVSFKPMKDPKGQIKCSASKRIKYFTDFDHTDFSNFNKFKESAGYPKADGYKVVDMCVYDSLRQSIPRPYWKTWRPQHETDILPPLEYISDTNYAWFTTYTVWVSVIILGFGSEYVVGQVITEYLSIKHLQTFWQAAQFTFPLFVTVALVSHSYFGLPFLVIGLWKCGSPETVVFFCMSRNKNEPWLFRVRCFLNFLGTALHHSATSLLIVSITTGSEFLDRNVLSCTLPLVVQHWFVLVRYIDVRLFIITEMLIEAVWEWELIWNMLTYKCHSWNFYLISWSMLIAHWLYLAAAGLKYCCSSKKSEKSQIYPDGSAKSPIDDIVYSALGGAELMLSKDGRSKVGAKLLNTITSLPAQIQLNPASDAQMHAHWTQTMAKSEGSQQKQEGAVDAVKEQ